MIYEMANKEMIRIPAGIFRNSAKLTLLLLNLEGRLTIGEACAQAARRMNSRATPSQSRPPPTGGTAAGRLGPT